MTAAAYDSESGFGAGRHAQADAEASGDVELPKYAPPARSVASSRESNQIAAIAPEFEVEVTTALEYGTDKPCQIGRLAYKLGVHRYVALTFRYLTEKMPDPWFLTWVGLEGGETTRLPEGCKPSDAMLAALAEVTG